MQRERRYQDGIRSWQACADLVSEEQLPRPHCDSLCLSRASFCAALRLSFHERLPPFMRKRTQHERNSRLRLHHCGITDDRRSGGICRGRSLVRRPANSFQGLRARTVSAISPGASATCPRSLDKNDACFLPAGAEAFKRDIPQATAQLFESVISPWKPMRGKSSLLLELFP